MRIQEIRIGIKYKKKKNSFYAWGEKLNFDVIRFAVMNEKSLEQIEKDEYWKHCLETAPINAVQINYEVFTDESRKLPLNLMNGKKFEFINLESVIKELENSVSKKLRFRLLFPINTTWATSPMFIHSEEIEGMDVQSTEKFIKNKLLHTMATLKFKSKYPNY